MKTKTRKPRTNAEMEAAIRAHPAFESMHWEDDGCFQNGLGRDVPGLWVYLKAGWEHDPQCGTIHEATPRQALQAIQCAKKTDWNLKK